MKCALIMQLGVTAMPRESKYFQAHFVNVSTYYKPVTKTNKQTKSWTSSGPRKYAKIVSQLSTVIKLLLSASTLSSLHNKFPYYQ